MDVRKVAGVPTQMWKDAPCRSGSRVHPIFTCKVRERLIERRAEARRARSRHSCATVDSSLIAEMQWVDGSEKRRNS